MGHIDSSIKLVRLTLFFVVLAVSEIAKPSTIITISIDGNPHPYITNQAGEGIGINPSTGQYEDALFGSSSSIAPSNSSIVLADIAQGTYQITLSGDYSGLVGLTISI